MHVNTIKMSTHLKQSWYIRNEMRCSKNQKLIAIAVAENVHTGLHKISTLSMSDS